jgi:signal transduction histidine kinase
MLVRDDGRGIDPQVLRSGSDGHWGLAGMRERAERIGASFKVRSRAAAGTEVELSVPGDVAFNENGSGRPGRRAAKFHWKGAGARRRDKAERHP